MTARRALVGVDETPVAPARRALVSDETVVLPRIQPRRRRVRVPGLLVAGALCLVLPAAVGNVRAAETAPSPRATTPTIVVPTITTPDPLREVRASVADDAAASLAAHKAETEQQMDEETAKPEQPASVEESIVDAEVEGLIEAVGACQAASSGTQGFLPATVAAYEQICARFPDVVSYGGWRPGGDDHGQGRAIDIMITDSAQGWEIAQWLVAHADALNVEYVIFEQRIWGTWASGAGFTPMEDRGSATANHFDHVHVTVG